MMPSRLTCTLFAILMAMWVSPGIAKQWSSYGADLGHSKYAPINQIHAGNASDLRVAWRWSSIDQPILSSRSDLWTWRYEATPIIHAGVLYVATSLSQIAAIDARTGQTLWSHDPESWRLGSPPNNGFLHRGVSFWDDGEDGRILIGTGHAKLLALSAQSGQPILSFGTNGEIDLTQGLRRPTPSLQYGVSSPPLVCGGVVVVGSSIWDYPFANAMAPGDVRAFSAMTGELLWIFESIPQGDDFGADTWKEGSADRFGNTNVWAPMSCDEALKLVYLPFGTPSNDYYGGERPGDNLFAEAIVAVDLQSGERAWHYQTVRHGIWDYDLPAAPTLLDAVVDGAPRQLLAQVSKQGFLYVLDRETGEPIWSIEEKVVPGSGVSGEQTAPTQPHPTRPAPFEQQGATEDDLIDFTSSLRSSASVILNGLDNGPLFTPPSQRGTITVPGVSGGGSWAGAAVHPPTGRIFVPSIKGVWTLSVHRNNTGTDYRFKGSPDYGPMGPLGLPLMKPPYGSITAIDLNTGDHLWRTAVGEGPRLHSAISHLNLPRLGWARRIFVLNTDSLLFAVQEGINIGRGSTPRRNASEIRTIDSEAFLHVFDPDTGTLLSSTTLPSNAGGSPMTYQLDGVQYIVIPIGGASRPAELVAVSLDPQVLGAETDQPQSPTLTIDTAFPNPASGSSRLQVSTNSPTLVSIDLYDVLGRHVRRVAQATTGPAGRSFSLEVRDLANGVYYYVVRAGDIQRGASLVVNH